MADSLLTRAAAVAALTLTFASGAPAQSGWTARRTATTPLPRSDPGLAYDTSRARTVLFGGSWIVPALGDTWEFDGIDWTQRTPTTSPPPRSLHGMTFDPAAGVAVLFGGFGASALVILDDTWLWDGVNWRATNPATRPPARGGGRLAFDAATGQVLLFGGAHISPGLKTHFDDTWLWDGAQWIRRSTTRRPSARWGHALATDFARGGVVLFGGLDAQYTRGDTWLWDGVDWSLQAPRHAPNARSWAGIATRPNDGLATLYGGRTFDTRTWSWDGSTWRIDDRTPRPPDLASHGMVHDVIRNVTLLIGGTGANPQTDVYEYRSGPIARVTAGAPNCSTSVGAATLESSYLPILGQTPDLELTASGPTNAAAVIAFGLDNSQWAAGPLPFDLAAYGLPSCELRVRPDATRFVTLTAGVATAPFAVPRDPGLTGIVIFAQGFVADPAANTGGILASNEVALTIGPM
ncbi:MAG: hypothetical protein NXI31_11285 [bacterium]|nr:hypothetical protein [bacterium]